MKVKAIQINDELHTAAKIFAYSTGRHLSRVCEIALSEYIKNNKHLVPTCFDVDITERANGRPASGRYHMCMSELATLDMKDIPAYPAFDDNQIGIINIKTDRMGLWVSGMNQATSVLIEMIIRGNKGNMLPASDLPVLRQFDGIEAIIMVHRTDLTPNNELAQMILSLTPPRNNFSKELLYVFASIGFNIQYVD